MTATVPVPASSPAYPHLFRPYPMGGLELRNRIVLAGHGSRFVDWHDHHVTDRQAAYLGERARGGVGLIIQGSGMVHPTGLAAPGVNEIWDDRSVPAYRVVADAVHEHGAAIFGQLSHLGRQGHGWASQRELWAPSAIADPASRVVPHAMTRREITELVDAYRQGAARYLAAGFDGLEVYLAHGYLLCSFLSPFSNLRTDAYGGSLENRCRLPLEVLDAVRAEVGADVPVGVRISADELVPGGIDVPEAQRIVAHLLGAVRVDYVNVSQSNYVTMDAQIPDMSYPRVPFVDNARRIREVSGGVPVMTVARIVTPEAAETLLADGTADFVCLVRPLIADPEWPAKARDGRRDRIRECISCNVGCRGGPLRGTPIACLVNPAVGREREPGVTRLTRAERPRHVLVVGGGPAGLKAAETAALRGHRVTLLEATDRLGGQVLVAAAAMPYRDEFANAVRHLERELRLLGVDVQLETPAGADTVGAVGADAVVVATGSLPGRLPVPGGDSPDVVSVQQAIVAGVAARSVVVVDCGEADWKSLTAAECLASRGHRVRVVTPGSAGAEIDPFSRGPLLRRLARAGVEILEHRSVLDVAPGTMRLRHAWSGGEERLSGVDGVVVSWYGVADDWLFHELDGRGTVEVHAAGDCVAPRRAIDAIWDGFRVGRVV